MSLPDELKPIFDRIAQHQQTDADIAALRQYLSTDGQLVSQQGKYNVNLGQGQDIHIGDRIYQGADAETIRTIVQTMMQELQVQPNGIPASEPTAEATKMSSGQRQRLEQRQATLQSEWNLRNQKIRHLRSALAIEAGASVKFQLEHQLGEEEAYLARLSEELDQLELTHAAAIPPKQETLVSSNATVEAVRSPQVQTSEISFDNLVQQMRSQASSKILNLFSKIQLLNKRQVEVDQLYVDVYVLEMREFHATISGLLEGRDQRDQFDQLGMGNRRARSQGLEIAASDDYPRLMVLGKPGSGKSTFLRHLAVGCAKGKFLGDYIPVVLELRDVDEADFSLFEYIHREWELELETQTEQILKRGQVLILLDGLDEVSSSLRQTVQNDLRKFVKRYDKNRFILTCRTQTTEYVPEHFKAVEVADFKPEQVESFALNWFTAMAETPEQGAALKDHFIDKLRGSPQTAALAVTPVLLSLTCWIFDDFKCLPQKRSDLYREGLNLLLQQWDESRGINRDSRSDRYQQLSTEQRKHLLSYVAARKFEQAENFVLFEESELCSYIAEHLQISAEESREVLSAIAQHHGLLIERAQGIWSFSHLTFQEYLVAKWFYSQTGSTNLFNATIDHYWREVFLLITEMSSDVEEFLLSMQSKIDLLPESSPILTNFLTWLYNKSLIVENEIKTSYTPATIRAFYFELCLLYFFRHQGLAIRAGLPTGITIRDVTTLDSCLIHTFNQGACWLGGRDYFLGDVENIVSNFVKVFNANCCQNAHEDNLRQFLEHLRDQLPSSDEDLDTCFEWWAQNGRVWLSNLYKAIEYRKLIWINGKQLNEEEKNHFRKYHTLNWLLLDCLNSSYSVTSNTRQKIQETLLLPIAEIEKRKRAKAE